MDKVIAILFGVVGLVMAIYYAIEFQKGKKDFRFCQIESAIGFAL